MNNSKREQVVRLRNSGLTYSKIGSEVGLSPERVRQLVKGKNTTKKEPVRNVPDALLTTAEVAELLNVHVNTVRRWSDKGTLKSYRIGNRGDRRFMQNDIVLFLSKLNGQQGRY